MTDNELDSSAINMFYFEVTQGWKPTINRNIVEYPKKKLLMLNAGKNNDDHNGTMRSSAACGYGIVIILDDMDDFGDLSKLHANSHMNENI